MYRHLLEVCLILNIIVPQVSVDKCSNSENPLTETELSNLEFERKKLNDYIYGLKYNRDSILSFNGEPTKRNPTKGYLDELKNFVVISHDSKRINSEKADIGVLSSNEHKTFPGSLLLANRRLIANLPDLLSVERGCLKYTVNLPDLGRDGSFTIIPLYSNYKASLNHIVSKWYESFPKSKNSWKKANALFLDGYILAYSKDQLRVKFGTEFKNTAIESDIDFEAIQREEKLVMILRFKRIFFTTFVESPKHPADVLGRGVTVEELAGKTDNQNPPVLVDSVSYGKVIYLRVETSSTDSEAKNILQFKLYKVFNNFNNITRDQLYSISRLKHINFHLYIMGSGRNQVSVISSNSIEEVNDFITKYSKFSQQNFGYPISYTCEFLKDNTRAYIKSTTEYFEITRTINRKGVIKLIHYGLYIAKWNVEWDEISHDSMGNEIVKHKGWYKNGNPLVLPFSEEIELNGNSRNISVSAKEFTGLFWEWWRIIFSRTNIPLVGHRKFKIIGTTIHPCYKIKPPL